jgi:hypothetical protein
MLSFLLFALTVCAYELHRKKMHLIALLVDVFWIFILFVYWSK